jgi:hypothetical protein
MTFQTTVRGLRILIAALSLSPAARADAPIRLGPNSSVVFASAEEGKIILTKRDAFVQALSPFDRSARLKTDRPVDEKEFLEFVGNSVLPWSNEDKQKVEAAFAALQPRLEPFSLPFPKTIYLIKTTGDEEGGAAYTRATAIVLPKAELARSPETLRGLVCHELFHVLSRANPELRERLYTAIGFTKCDEVELPASLQSRKITNPDAPQNDHCIRLQSDGKAVWAVPLLISRSEKYDVARGGRFFDYLQFKFLLVERDDGTGRVEPLTNGTEPRLVGMRQVSGYLEQVGKNTDYIIHPEEILAENFRLLGTGTDKAASPEVLARIREILASQKPSPPGATPDAQRPAP